MPGKSSRPFSGDPDDLQKRLQNAQNALVELSEQSCSKDQAVARLVELLRSASNEISYLSSRVLQNELPLDIIVIEEAELDATARWYRALDDEDRDELLMEENALEEEWQWMPRFMAHLARTSVRVQTDTRVPAHPKHANHGHWLKEKRHRLHRLAAQTLKNRSTSCITLFQLAKGIDWFWMHVSTPTHQQDMKLGDGLHHQVIQRVRKQLISWSLAHRML